MLVLNKSDEKILGLHVPELSQVDDVSVKHMIEPFVNNHGFIIFKDQNLKYGIISPRLCIIREVVNYADL